MINKSAASGFGKLEVIHVLDGQFQEVEGMEAWLEQLRRRTEMLFLVSHLLTTQSRVVIAKENSKIGR